MKTISFVAVLAFICFFFPANIEAAQPLFSLYDPGTQFPVNYEEFGIFSGAGTSNYSYTLIDSNGLGIAVGEGIYPNTNSVYQDPEYQRYLAEGKLDGNQWDFVDSPDPKADFYKWATLLEEEEGVRMFFLAHALLNAGLIEHAIKAYYAIVVSFPYAQAPDQDNVYWYIAPAAVNMIDYLCREYPDVGLKLINARVDVDSVNSIFTAAPGNFITYSREDRISEMSDLSKLQVVQTRGSGKVQLVKYSNGHWQLKVDGKPFIIKGITYSPTRVGLGCNETLLWQTLDENNSGLIDAPYESWVDEDRDNQQDINEPTVGDFQLLKEMGCNAIRLYHSAGSDNMTYMPGDYNKPLLRDLYKRYGIRVVMGDFIGAYCIGSGADWSEGTDYTNPQQRENMKNVVRAMVLDHKDEPYVLFWLLGNENNLYVTNTNASRCPIEYSEFLNELADMIHQLDPNHPVAVGNYELDTIKYYAQYAPALDILGVNSYPGKYGFGVSFYAEAKESFDRPVFFTEYGADAYHTGVGVNEREQAEYGEGCWKDIVYNSAGNPGKGIAIGGMIFEWMDEWWKAPDDSDFNHQTEPQFRMGTAPDGWSNEEWYGVCGQVSGINSPFLRELRQIYYSYENMWAPPITRNSSNGNVILSWGTYPGLTYDVYYSNDSINWALAQSGLPASGISQTNWTDDGTYTGSHPDSIPIRYYRVIINNTTPPRKILEVNSGGSCSGKVTFQNRTNYSDTVTFEIRKPGYTTPIKIYTITTGRDGSYNLADMPRGTYDLTAKVSNSLRGKKTNITVSANQETTDMDFSLLLGDCDNNNFINAFDSSILNAAFRSTPSKPNWDKRADLDNNGLVNAFDYSILNSNFRKMGAQ